MNNLTIGKVASQAGIGVETVRFYERKGLLPKPPRNGAGYRQYPPETVARLLFIKRAKELGFSLREITEILALRHGQDATCGDVKKQAQLKLHDIDEKIRDLTRIKEALTKLTCQCNVTEPISACPIIDAMKRQE